MVDNREYGLVLAGGGTKGAYQVGVWKALKELNNKGVKMYGISGNHTLKYTNSIDNHSISWDMWISENFSFIKRFNNHK